MENTKSIQDKALEMRSETIYDLMNLRQDAARQLRGLIRTMEREAATLDGQNMVSIDWIENDARKYHDMVVKMTDLNSQLMYANYVTGLNGIES